ncbi:hypothetical protein PspLS_05413 [Pyricularia sp. CBS 133598]|nr:hypothetical protein PspLS_05413 [Pyricularia sp. CBS 133598]
MDRARSLEAASKERPRSRIMGRKILPSGFSVFNPGGGSGRLRLKPRTACFFSPSSEIPSATQQQQQQQQLQSHTGRSVQEIVRWMEKAENATTSTASVAASPVSEQQSSSQPNITCKPVTPITAAGSPCTTVTPSGAPPIAADASGGGRGEQLKNTPAASEYTPLTMLEYRAYMNNRPLGRCLDDYTGENDLLFNDDSAAVILGDETSDDQDAEFDHLLQELAGDPSPNGNGAEPQNTKDEVEIINKNCPPRGPFGNAVFALKKAVFAEPQPVDVAVQPPILTVKGHNTHSEGHLFSPKDAGNKGKGPSTGSLSVNGQSKISCITARTSHLIDEPKKAGALPFRSTEMRVEKLRTPLGLHIRPETGDHGSGESTVYQYIPKVPPCSDERHRDKRASLETPTKSRTSHSLERYQAGRRQQEPEQPTASTAMTITTPPAPTSSPPPPPSTQPQPYLQRWRTVSESREVAQYGRQRRLEKERERKAAAARCKQCGSSGGAAAAATPTTPICQSLRTPLRRHKSSIASAKSVEEKLRELNAYLGGLESEGEEDKNRM